MLKLNGSAVIVIADETQKAVDAIDQAYVQHLRMTAETVDALRTSGAAISDTQRLMRMLHDGHSDVLALRKKTQTAISMMQLIHQKSDQAETALGCPEGWGFFTRAEADDTVEANLPEAQAA